MEPDNIKGLYRFAEWLGLASLFSTNPRDTGLDQPWASFYDPYQISNQPDESCLVGTFFQCKLLLMH